MTDRTEDIRRVIAGAADPLRFAHDLFLWLPDGAPTPPQLRASASEWFDHLSDTAPALAVADWALVVADYLNAEIRPASFFYDDAEAGIAVGMLHRLAQWLAGEHHEPVPAMIAGILAEITGLLHAIYDKYEADWLKAQGEQS